jgi:hypothetical protein
MPRDARAGVLAALREIYDGSWTRHVGTDGGRTLSWSGRVGFIGGCPPTIDRHHAVMASLGERFLLLRLPEASEQTAVKALAHAGRESTMRREMAEAVSSFLGRVAQPAAPLVIGERECAYLVRLAMLTSRCRSPVERDGYTHEIELVPGAEAPTRLVVTLKRLHDGLSAIGVERAQRWGIVRRVALDSIPAVRRKALLEVARLGEATTTGIAAALGYPPNTIRRTLEDLAAYQVLDRTPGPRNADLWRVASTFSPMIDTLPQMSGSPSARPEMGVPEKLDWAPGDRSGVESAPLLLPVPGFDDKSGTRLSSSVAVTSERLSHTGVNDDVPPPVEP